jgi:stress response protein SCP2
LRILSRGERVPLSTIVDNDRIQIGVALEGPFTLDVSCFALDEHGVLALPADDHVVFYNQPRLGDAVALVDGAEKDLAAFDIALDRVTHRVCRLVIVASIDGDGAMSDMTSGEVIVRASGDAVARFPLDAELFTTERAVVLAEVYRRDGWRISAVAQGFTGGLDALVVHFGGTVDVADTDAGTAGEPGEAQGPDDGGRAVIASAISVAEVVEHADGVTVDTVTIDAVEISMAKVATEDRATAPVADATKSRGTVRTSKSAASTMPKWERAVRERLTAAVKAQRSPLTQLAARKANESDTRIPITELLVEGLGYHRYDDLTTEMRVKGDLADYGLRIDGELVAFVEVKRVGIALADRHLKQVRNYALDSGVAWMVLTNGPIWELHRLTLVPGQPAETDLTFRVDLLGDEALDAKVSKLFLLSKESMRRHQVDVVWERQRARSAQALTAALLSAPVLDALRKELRRQTGHNESIEEIDHLLRTTVLPKSSR